MKDTDSKQNLMSFTFLRCGKSAFCSLTSGFSGSNTSRRSLWAHQHSLFSCCFWQVDSSTYSTTLRILRIGPDPAGRTEVAMLWAFAVDVVESEAPAA